MKWDFTQIDGLTFPDAEAMFAYWREYPPENELAAMKAGFGKEMTMDEKIARGAAGPGDLLRKGKKYVHRLGDGKPN